MTTKIDPRAIMSAALAHVREVNQGQIPNGRTDVDVDPTGNYPARIWPPNPIETALMVRVYGATSETPVLVQFDTNGIRYSANVGKSGRIGKVVSFSS